MSPRELWRSGKSIARLRVSVVPVAAGAGGCGRGAKGSDMQDPTRTQGCCWQPPPSHGDPPAATRTCSRGTMPAVHPCSDRPDSHPCASWALRPAVPVPPGVPCHPPGTPISVFPEHPRPPGLRVPVPALGEPRAVRRQDPPSPFRPVPSRLSRSVPAPLRSALPCPGTAQQRTAAPR